MIEINDKVNCSGCTACYAVCPQSAIEMKLDEEGFKYPRVDKNRCVECGLCNSVCPILNKRKIGEETTSGYIVQNKNDSIRLKSTSGAAINAIAEYVISCGGVVFGCEFSDDRVCRHTMATDISDLGKFQGSKYVQSELGDCFKSIKEQLDADKKVLFIGTPCQVEAIEKYLNRKELDNLITCDLVCHGVPSPKLFKNYLNYLSKKYNRKVTDYRFRNKTTFDKCGFRGKLKIAQKDKYFFAEEDIYYRDFLEEKNYRLSCYNCKYKVNKRVGDFTIGDVNSWENYYDFYPELASSLVIVNNSKAKNLFDELEQKLFVKEISLEKEKKINKALSRQTELPEERKQIYQKYKNLKQYEDEITIDIDKKMQIKNIMKIVIPFKVRIFVKKILKRMNKNE